MRLGAIAARAVRRGGSADSRRRRNAASSPWRSGGDDPTRAAPEYGLLVEGCPENANRSRVAYFPTCARLTAERAWADAVHRLIRYDYRGAHGPDPFQKLRELEALKEREIHLDDWSAFSGVARHVPGASSWLTT